MFNYNNYIGEHMNESLMVTDGRFSYSVNMDNIRQIVENTNCKPKIKSPSDLTDDEWLFVLGYEGNGACRIERFYGNSVTKECTVFIYYNDVCLDIRYDPTFGFSKCDQQLLNRIYSLHVSLDYEELIKNNLAVRKDAN